MPRSNRVRGVESVKPRWHQTWWMQLLVAIWRWLPEILILTGIVAISITVFRADLPVWAAAAVLVAPVSLALLVPVTSRFIRAVFWLEVTRHRLRSYFSNNGLRNRDGRLPWLLCIYPTKVGEAAWIVLVGGICAKDIEERLKSLGSTCWAREGRLTVHKRFSHLVRLEIIRRDPFTKPVSSKLLGRKKKTAEPELVPPVEAGRTQRASNWSIGIGIPGENPPDTTTDTGGGSDTNRIKSTLKKTTKESKSASKQGAPDNTLAPAVVVNGEDVSDYV